MFETSHIEISASALKSNLDFIRTIIGEQCILSSVVKGNAYGHGIEEFVPLAEECGIAHFSVFSADEAYRVHQISNQKSTILIMGMVDRDQLEWVIENGIEFYVFDIPRLKNALAVAEKLNIPAKIHIEMETGMNRTGFTKKELSVVHQLINQHPSRFNIQGFCTHFAGAESITNFYRIKKQMIAYTLGYKWCIKNGLVPLQKHTACSAASMNYPSSRMDMVRIGIMQYGFWPSKETLFNYLSKRTEKIDPLIRVITWKSKVMNIKIVKEREFVGYGTSFQAENDMMVATVPVGYSNGYSRSLSNQGKVLINGHKVSVIGIVNMNMLLVDISNIPETKEGEEVILIGSQGEHNISVSSFSEMSSQLNYELLTRLSSKIPRKVVP